MQPLLIVKTGSTFPALVARRGDYEEWIRAGLGPLAGPLRVIEVFGETGPQALPEPGSIRGAVVTGSSAMVSAREPWSERSGAWLRGAVEAGTPVLGICYGHQLLAHALGGRVGRNPRGREIGTVELRLHGAAARDPLLRVLPPRGKVQATHVESVLELPAGAEPLASSAGDPHAAFALGSAAWGVQFHPEFDADVMRFYLRERRNLLRDEGLDADALERAVEEAPAGALLLRRFAELAG